MSNADNKSFIDGYKYTDHLNNGFNTIQEMCDFWGIKRTTYEMRRSTNMSIEDALTLPLNKDKKGLKWRKHKACAINRIKSCDTWEDHLGNMFSSIEEMCSNWSVDKDTYLAKMKDGWTVKQSLLCDYSDAIGCTDIMGKHYNTLKDMCRYWGISYRIYLAVTDVGGTFEDVLDINYDAKCMQYASMDHLGNKYDTLKEMCKKYNISVGLYLYKLHCGMSVKDALTKQSLTVKDHLGNEFNTVHQMCKYWGVSYGTYRNRRNHGMSLKDAITMDDTGRKLTVSNKTIRKSRRYKTRQGKYKDHLDILYNNFNDMCRNYGISPSTVRGRLKRGLTLEQALTSKKTLIDCNKIYVDHEGNRFTYLADMCKHWNITPQCLRDRLKQGYSLEYTLTMGRTKISKPGVLCTDHTGKEYKSIKDMCDHWGIDRRLYVARMRYGWTVKEALTTKVHKPRKNNEEHTKIECIDHLGNEYTDRNGLVGTWLQ